MAPEMTRVPLTNQGPYTITKRIVHVLPSHRNVQSELSLKIAINHALKQSREGLQPSYVAVWRMGSTICYDAASNSVDRSLFQGARSGMSVLRQALQGEGAKEAPHQRVPTQAVVL